MDSRKVTSTSSLLKDPVLSTARSDQLDPRHHRRHDPDQDRADKRYGRSDRGIPHDHRDPVPDKPRQHQGDQADPDPDRPRRDAVRTPTLSLRRHRRLYSVANAWKTGGNISTAPTTPR